MLHADAIESFITTDDKPDWCRSPHVAVMVYLMAMAGHDGKCALRMVKIAMCTGGGEVNWRGTRVALDKLEEEGWISVDKKPGERRMFTVHFGKISPRVQKGANGETK